MLAKHVLDADHITEMRNNHFQDGLGAFTYLQTACARPTSMLRLREMNKNFDDIDIIHDIGIGPNTIKLHTVQAHPYDERKEAGCESQDNQRDGREAPGVHLYHVEAL